MPTSKRAPRAPASHRVHSVSAKISVKELTKAGTAIVLEIERPDGKLGELEIGRGALYWTGRSRKKAVRISWSRFAEMMDELAGLNLR
jgi:hypothetical protein